MQQGPVWGVENMSESPLTFNPINNTMVRGFAKNQVCLFVSIHLLIICLNLATNNNYHLQLGQGKGEGIFINCV